MATKVKNKKNIASPKDALVSGRKKPVVSTKSSVSKTNENKLSILRTYKLKKSHAVSLVVILIVATLIFAFRSFIVAASVNGQPITRLAVVKEAEKQGGKQVLESLVTNTLIEQEARKQKVTVTDIEI